MGLFDEQEIKSTMEELENIANKIAMPKTDEKNYRIFFKNGQSIDIPAKFDDLTDLHDNCLILYDEKRSKAKAFFNLNKIAGYVVFNGTTDDWCTDK